MKQYYNMYHLETLNETENSLYISTQIVSKFFLVHNVLEGTTKNDLTNDFKQL